MALNDTIHDSGGWPLGAPHLASLEANIHKARQEIYRVIRRLADEGVAVVVVSSDFVELQELADAIYFMTSTSMSERKPVTEEVNEQYIYKRLNERVRASHSDD